MKILNQFLVGVILIFNVPIMAMQQKEVKEQARIQEFKRALNQNEIPAKWMLDQLEMLDKNGLSEGKLKKIATRKALCKQEIYERKRYQNSTETSIKS